MAEETENRILLSPPDVGDSERAALVRAFDSGWIAPLGPEVDAFEAELADYVGADACVALASGTAGLRLSLLAVGVEAGDEVLVQSATFAASAFAVAQIGARPTFLDSNWATWTMDPSVLEDVLHLREAEGRLPAAVMPVDLYGMVSDYAALEKVCARYGVPIVADAAEALGSESESGRAGSLGTLGAVSFNGNKIITTSGGGAVFGDGELVAHIRHLSTQAREPYLYYEHHSIGYNDRLSNILAAMGRSQLSSLDAKIERRQQINSMYRDALQGLVWSPRGVTTRCNSWLSVGLVPDGLDVLAICQEMSLQGVEARPAWKPMHRQPVFETNDWFGTDVSDEIYRRGICLPSGSGMSDSDVDRVIHAFETAAASTTGSAEAIG